MPNPTLIERGEDTLIVFSAYLLHEISTAEMKLYNKDKDNAGKVVENKRYPTVYFYDTARNRVKWEIFGSEAFVSYQHENDDVFYLSSEIW